MPRDGSEVYYIPPGTEGIPDTTIESTKYNTFIHDVEADLNYPRPISAGGTGGTTIEEAIAELGAEKAAQVVVNFDSHLWVPGSFYAATTATGAPVSGHAFVGWVVSSDPLADPPTNMNLVLHARDQSDTFVPGKLYVREKKAGIWGPWVIETFYLFTSETPPVGAPLRSLWWESDSGLLYVLYDDGSGAAQWVIACPQPDITSYVMKTGDTMTGPLNLSTDPIAGAQQAATKTYVDTKIASAISAIPSPPPIIPAGSMLFFYNAAAPTGWTKVTAGANDQAIRVVSGSGGVPGGSVPFSTVFGRTGTDGFSLAAGHMAQHQHTIADSSGITILDFEVAGGWDFTPGGQLKTLAINHVTGLGTGLFSTAHSHTIDMRVFYLDVILCYKN